MRVVVIVAALLLAGCGSAPEPAKDTAANAVVSVSLPDEPAVPWTGEGGAVIERDCLACHSPEMIANQPPLGPEKWQATIDKMRTVYHAEIDKTDDPALIAALRATQAPAKP